MIGLKRFEYKKGGKETKAPLDDLTDIIPETPPKKKLCEQLQVANSSSKKRKFDLSSDEEGSEDVFNKFKKTRITHFMKKPTEKKKQKKENEFLSPESGSEQEEEDGENTEKLSENEKGDDRLPTLRKMFTKFSDETLKLVCDVSFTIDGAIAMLTRWKSEDIKNQRGGSSSPERKDSQNSLNSSSYDSPLFVAKKKKKCLRLESCDTADEKPSAKSSRQLGLSSSGESESDSDDNDTKPKGPFPRLSCVIPNNGTETKKNNISPDEDNESEVNKNDEFQKRQKNGICSFYSKKEKSRKNDKHSKKKHSEQPKSFLHESLTLDNETDESFFAEIDSDDSDEDVFNFGTKMKKQILDFFQDWCVDEMSSMRFCSQKRSELIHGLKPFKSWNDLVAKIENTKNLGSQIIPQCVDLLKERVIFRQLLGECRNISSKLTTEIETLHCHDHMTEGNTLMKAPSTIPSHLILKPYQLVGLNWINLLHRNGVNGILADEMGLGKTIQTISFLAHLLEQDSGTGPHIVVVPSSTIDNWCREFSLWCPSMDVVLYRGSQQERRSIRVDFLRGRRTANVIVTTYNSAISTSEDRAFFRKLDAEYAIFDEGHMLKNMSSQRYVNLMKIRAARKLLLTGTPLQNNLLELMSLLRFVMPHMFEQTTDTLVRIFSSSGSDNQSKFAKDRIQDAKNIMQPFVLRRLKDEVLKQLPEKTAKIIYCDMTKEQSQLYEETKERYRLKLNKKSALEMKNAFIELRKIANHPLLRRNFYTTDKLVTMAKLLKREPEYRESEEKLIVEDMTVMTDFEIHRFSKTTGAIRKFALDESTVLNTGKFRKLDELLPEYEKRGDRVVIFSQFVMIMDIMEKYLKLRKVKFIRLDGSTPVTIRLGLIDKFNTDTSILVFLLSTKAGGLGINLTSANIVIVHDIDMNPYNDKQAEDRCHRLGQTKKVEIIRLVSKDSIEEGMLQMAKNKLKLEQEMTTSAGIAHLNIIPIHFLKTLITIIDTSDDIASLLGKTLAK